MEIKCGQGPFQMIGHCCQRLIDKTNFIIKKNKLYLPFVRCCDPPDLTSTLDAPNLRKSEIPFKTYSTKNKLVIF